MGGERRWERERDGETCAHVSCAGVAHTQVPPTVGGCLRGPLFLAPRLCVDFNCDDLLLPLHTGVYIYLVECIDTSFSFFSFFSFSFFSW